MIRKCGKKVALILAVISIGILLPGLFAGVKYLDRGTGRETDTGVRIYYIHNNPCESCREYLHFVQEFKSEIKDEVPAESYHMQELNLLLDGSGDTYEKLMKELKVPAEDRLTPMLIIGDRYLIGSEDIKKKRKELLLAEGGLTEPVSAAEGTSEGRKAEAEIPRIPGIEPEENDSYILYFSTTACESCEKASGFLDSLPETFQADYNGKSIFSKLVVEERNITEAGNLALYQELLAVYKVPEKERVVPMVFYQGGFLSGKDSITDRLEGILKDGGAVGFKEIVTAGTKNPDGLTLKDIPKVLGAGLAGGLNPCSFSMLFLLLSLIAARKNSVLKLGGVYLAGKLIAYTVIALFFYHILNVLESNLFASVQGTLRILMVAAALLFAVLSFLDFLKARKEQYGKMVLKLPKKLRNADSSIMQRLMSNSKKPLWIIVFLLGFIISAGEFLCSGQVYLATLLTMNHLDNGTGNFGYFLILIYILVMLLPSLCVVILVYRGKRLQVISDFILRHTGAIKLINMAVFLLMGIIFLFY